jgi:hypothetical protein
VPSAAPNQNTKQKHPKQKYCIPLLVWLAIFGWECARGLFRSPPPEARRRPPLGRHRPILVLRSAATSRDSPRRSSSSQTASNTPSHHRFLRRTSTCRAPISDRPSKQCRRQRRNNGVIIPIVAGEMRCCECWRRWRQWVQPLAMVVYCVLLLAAIPVLVNIFLKKGYSAADQVQKSFYLFARLVTYYYFLVVLDARKVLRKMLLLIRLTIVT